MVGPPSSSGQSASSNNIGYSNENHVLGLSPEQTGLAGEEDHDENGPRSKSVILRTAALAGIVYINIFSTYTLKFIVKYDEYKFENLFDTGIQGLVCLEDLFGQ